MVYKIILIDLRQFVPKMLGKIKFDSLPFLQFCSLNSSKTQAMGQAGKGPTKYH